MLECGAFRTPVAVTLAVDTEDIMWAIYELLLALAEYQEQMQQSGQKCLTLESIFKNR